MLPQLGSVLAAVQSAEVAKEDQYHRPVAPEIAQTMGDPVAGGQGQ
jgi:hypothetical protein